MTGFGMSLSRGVGFHHGHTLFQVSVLDMDLTEFLKHLPVKSARLRGYGVDLRRQAVMQEECGSEDSYYHSDRGPVYS